VNTLDNGTDLINAFVAHGQALWLAMLPGSYFLDVVTARRAFPKPSAVAHLQNQAFAVSGTRAGTSTAYNLCPSIFLIPPMGTKSGGRVFLPAVAQGDIINNSFLAAYRTAIDNFFGTMISGMAGSGTNWKLAIFSRKLVSASLVASFGPSSRLGYQSRRRRPVGSA
jgi:hypothetical protein